MWKRYELRGENVCELEAGDEVEVHGRVLVAQVEIGSDLVERVGLFQGAHIVRGDVI